MFVAQNRLHFLHDFIVVIKVELTAHDEPASRNQH
jgi:hypothetical protein